MNVKRRILNLIYNDDHDYEGSILEWSNIPWTKRRSVRWWIEHGIKQKVDDVKRIPRETKFIFQRSRQGWSHKDTWGLDSYLSRVIYESIEHLRDNTHGNPLIDGFYDDTGSEIDGKDAFIEWKRILSEIAWTFRTAEKIGNEWIYQETNNWSQEWYEKSCMLNKEALETYAKNVWTEEDCHSMTFEECKRYEEGWRLFQKYFNNLWD